MKLRVAILTLCAFLLSTPVALAGGTSSGAHGYGGQAGVVQAQVQSGTGSLPFTGTDLFLLVGGGLLLVLLGVSLRLFARPRSHA
ncbi:MAG: hypothetical protein ACXVY8_07635 [Gaiellaceae bacterium]